MSANDKTKTLLKIEEALVLDIIATVGADSSLLVMRNEANVFTRLLDFVPERLKKGPFWGQFHKTVRYGLGIGSPDLLIVGRGWFVFEEVKRPKGVHVFPDGERFEYDAGQLSESQVEWHAKAAIRGIVVPVVRSVAEAVAAVEEVRGGKHG